MTRAHTVRRAALVAALLLAGPIASLPAAAPAFAQDPKPPDPKPPDPKPPTPTPEPPKKKSAAQIEQEAVAEDFSKGRAKALVARVPKKGEISIKGIGKSRGKVSPKQALALLEKWFDGVAIEGYKAPKEFKGLEARFKFTYRKKGTDKKLKKTLVVTLHRKKPKDGEDKKSAGFLLSALELEN